MVRITPVIKKLAVFPTTVMINPGFEVVGNEVSGLMRAV
jgi:hypothetical protein